MNMNKKPMKLEKDITHLMEDELSAIENGEIEIELDDNVAFTENGALAYKTTKSDLLDMFAVGGALRSLSEHEIAELFEKAFNENAELATKMAFYFRDIRGGQGERKTFRTILSWLGENYPSIVRKNLIHVAEYGRWDDLWCLLEIPQLQADVLNLIDIQLAVDKASDKPSLLAKWLPSENASSKKSAYYARLIASSLGLSAKQYRKTLSSLRKKIVLVEQRMSDNEWGAIEYDKIPSKAGLQYRNAFRRHDEERYNQFQLDVAEGRKTVNSGTLFPYEIVEKVSWEARYGYNQPELSKEERLTLDNMWNNLPNYFEDSEGVRGLVVADVSGSMTGRPMNVSVSLAIYTAERNTGPFAGKYMTFTDKPSLITVDTKKDLLGKVNQVMTTDVGYNTDIEAVFDLILNTAKKNELSQNDLPTHLYVVSDMEFDSANRSGFDRKRADKRLFQTIEKKYTDAGYKMPFLVFWNVNSRNNQQPMTMDDRGFQLVSGCSPSIFKSLLANKVTDAYSLMLEVLNDERYSNIRVE